MRNRTGWWIVMVFLISGCTFNLEVMTPAPSPLPMVETQGVSSPTATLSPTVEVPSSTPIPPSGPAFHGAFLTTDPASAVKETIFPAGTKQVFAVWNYQNMRAGLTVKREWYLHGQLWLTREEAWDMTKYGESGVVRDVSIRDFDAGLYSGVYQLRIYIDNVIQPIGVSVSGQPETQITFEIRRNEEAQASSSMTPPIPGDLGLGSVHGRITDAVTGAPIAGATITCDHHSYTSTNLCLGSVTTGANGTYVFENVFFHDTDSIKLTVQATGYQSQEISQTSFTRNDMEVDISLGR